MLSLLVEHAIVLITLVALILLPGMAMVRMLALRSVLPSELLFPAALTLALVPISIVTAIQLALTLPATTAVIIYLLMVGMIVAASVVHGKRSGSGAPRRSVEYGEGIGAGTIFFAISAGVIGWAVRGQIKFDTLYHASVSRKLLDLYEPSFSNINRFEDGGPNPAYALPAWHDMIAWVAKITSADVLAVWQILPALIVAIAVLAVAGLGRVVTGSQLGGAIAGGSWIMLRILFGRREVDGDAIGFGAHPGPVVFEIILPMFFALLMIAFWSREPRVARRTMPLIAACILAIIVLHANYVAYIFIVGAGVLLWWLVSGPLSAVTSKRVLGVTAAVTAMSVAGLAVLLPTLAKLENFGNAPEDARIDYHLTTFGGADVIRGGHLYEYGGMVGLVAMLLVPLIAIRLRRPEAMIVPGGLLGIAAFAFIPQLFALVRASGSLTIGLRLNHVTTPLYCAAIAVAFIWLARWLRQRESSLFGIALIASPIAGTLMVLGVAYRYRTFGPDEPGYLAAALLVVAAGYRLFARTRSERRRETPRSGIDRTIPKSTAIVLVGIIFAGFAIPAGYLSAERLAGEALDWKPAVASDDLSCMAGPVSTALQRLEPGALVLADPETSFEVMALAPVYVVGDYKVWNAATADNRTVDRLAEVNQFFDSSQPDSDRLSLLERYQVEYLLVDLEDPRWFKQAGADDATTNALRSIQNTLDQFADIQSYDGRSTVALIESNSERFELLARDKRAVDEFNAAKFSGVESDDDVSCRTFALWRVAAMSGA